MEREGRGFIHWSVWLIEDWGREERKQQLWKGWDCFREWALCWQKSGKHVTSLTFSESSRILDTLLQLLPDLKTWQLGQTLRWRWCFKGSVHANYKKIALYFTCAGCNSECRFYLLRFCDIRLWKLCHHPKIVEVKWISCGKGFERVWKLKFAKLSINVPFWKQCSSYFDRIWINA